MKVSPKFQKEVYNLIDKDKTFAPIRVYLRAFDCKIQNQEDLKKLKLFLAKLKKEFPEIENDPAELVIRPAKLAKEIGLIHPQS